MSKVWRRLQRVGKKASKYRFATGSHALQLNCTNKWKAQKVCLIWMHRNRKHSSKLATWEPSLGNIYDGKVLWDPNDMIEFEVTLYKSINEDKFEEKEWTLVIESEDTKGKRNLLASAKMNLECLVSIEPFAQREIKDLQLKPISSKVKSATLSFVLTSQFLKEGKATDEDMISIASYMSTASNANPYYNSNRFTRFGASSGPGSDSEADDTTTAHHNDSSSQSKNIFQMTDDDDDDDNDFNNYFKFNTLTPSKIKGPFTNNIEHHFKQFKQKPPETPPTIRSDPNDSTVVGAAPGARSSISASLDSTPSLSSMNNTTMIRKKLAALVHPGGKSSAANKTTTQQQQPSLLPNQTKINESKTLKSSADRNNPFQESSSGNPFAETPKCDVAKTTKDSTSFLDASNTSKELLVWCQNIVDKVGKDCPEKFGKLKIVDFTNSWSDGRAFCAIIYNYRPGSINLSNVSENDTKANLREAFTASDEEKIMRVVDYPDIINRKQIDSLSIMTYLYQIRDYFENASNASNGGGEGDQSFVSQMEKEWENVEKSIKKLSIKQKKKQQDQQQQQKNDNPFDDFDETEKENGNDKQAKVKTEDSKNPFNDQEPRVDSSANNTTKKLESTNSSEDLIRKAKILIEKTKLDEKAGSNTTTTTTTTSSNPDHLKQRAKEMMSAHAANRKSSLKKSSKQQQQQQQQAPVVIVSSPNGSKTMHAANGANENNGDVVVGEANKKKTVSRQSSTSNANELLGAEYINAELAELREKQRELDEQGAKIEKQLRGLMKDQDDEESSDVDDQAAHEASKQTEDSLLREWFLLVNKKNALLHRQQELEILQNEKNLEKRYVLLSNQLRQLMSMDEDLKSDEQRRAEAILFTELINLVNKRNELVIQLDEENKLLNEGEMINDFIQNKTTFIPKEKQCAIQ